MSTEWIKKKRENWPKGSLERFLSLNGAKSITDVVAKRMTNEPHKLPKEDHDDYKTIKKIVDELSELLKGYDIAKMDQITRKKLASMPLNSVKDALRWKSAWEREIKDHGEVYRVK